MTECAGGFMSDPNSEYYIPDSSIQASSEYSPKYKASYGRLHNSVRWVAATHDTQPWIEADLGRLFNVCGIQTQGSGTTNWLITLKVSTYRNVPVMGDSGDFIQYGNEVKVCISINSNHDNISDLKDNE